MKVNANLADISTKVDPLPEEEYTLKLTAIEVTKSKSTQKPMIAMTWQVQGGEYDGRNVYEYITFETKDGKPNEGGLRRFKRLVASQVGMDRANSDDFDTDEILNCEIQAYIIQEEGEYQGETQVSNRIKKYLVTVPDEE